ncbi:hypothetical protein ACHQM5_025163 [Ranunculus cassubicifolius]
MATEGTTETKVNTVDYRSPAGEDQPAIKENVQIVHQTEAGDEKSVGAISTAAAAVTNVVQSAKDAISGDNKTKDEETTSK